MKLLRLLFTFLGLFSCHLFAQHVIRGPYLQNAIKDAVTIKWRTDSLSNSRVSFGLTPGNLNQFVDSAGRVSDHTVRISGLQPYTRYYYSVGTSLTTLAGGDSLHYFTTAPIPGTIQPIKIWVLGDFGRNNNPQRWVRDSYLNYREINRPADVWLWLGDNAYDIGTDLQYQTNVFDIYPDLFVNQCFWPTPGNHDYYSVNNSGQPAQHTGPYYSIVEVPYQGEAGGLPSGGEMMYSFDYGNVHFVSLNSELGPWITTSQSPMTQWLEDDLQATTQPWKIVYFHQPPHTKGSHNSDNFWETNMIAMRNNIMPVVEANGVDLVLCGHSHVYERSFLVNGFYGYTWEYNSSYEVDASSGTDSLGEAYRKFPYSIEPDKGTVYAVVGNGGSSFGSASLNHPMMYYGWGCDTCVGSLFIDVLGNRLDAKFMDHTGIIRDDFTIFKDTSLVANQEAVALVQDMLVQPNPFWNRLDVSFELKTAAKVQFRMLDINGLEVYSRKLGQTPPGRHEIYLEDPAVNLPTGTYFLQLLVNDAVSNRKVIKYRP